MEVQSGNEPRQCGSPHVDHLQAVDIRVVDTSHRNEGMRLRNRQAVGDPRGIHASHDSGIVRITDVDHREPTGRVGISET